MVPPGTYTLMVTMPGFATYSALNVKIAGRGADVRCEDADRGAAQVVTVQANAAQLSVARTRMRARRC